MSEENSSLNFARGLLPRKIQPRRGDPLPSTMLGALSIVLGIVNMAAIFGKGPESIPNLVKQATIVLIEPPDPGSTYGGKTALGWWFVPEPGFWVLAFAGLALAALGVYLSHRRGRPITSTVGFALNTIVAIAGYILVFTDFQK